MIDLQVSKADSIFPITAQVTYTMKHNYIYFILSEAFIFWEKFPRNVTLFFTEIQEKTQNSVVYSTGVFYESSINFWTFKYDAILPNKSRNIFLNYSLLIIVLLAIKGT